MDCTITAAAHSSMNDLPRIRSIKTQTMPMLQPRVRGAALDSADSILDKQVEPHHPLRSTPWAVSGWVFRTVLNSSTTGLFMSSAQSYVRTDLLFFFFFLKCFFVLSETQPAGFKESKGFEGENVGVRIKERRNADVASCWFLLPVHLNSVIGTREKSFLLKKKKVAAVNVS